MELELNEVCETWLDNALVELDLSQYPSVCLEFVVLGSIDEYFRSVKLDCKKVVNMQLQNDDDWPPGESFSVLGVQIKRVPLSLRNKEMMLQSSRPWMWEVRIDGDIEVDLRCFDLSWTTGVLSTEEYEVKIG
ncbi:hypothetical protein [Vibrio barjaei]|uniref:hypothetical protein n=1 Tax=Vibrio barjaei TaxID=1676683 RepID=UPI002283BA85|nr:hypothetical protein [Vibrio barjaei]MCY9870378.1 hypothetical protein [Vibrio barjaei]